jgi:hypothetical protein
MRLWKLGGRSTMSKNHPLESQKTRKIGHSLKKVKASLRKKIRETARKKGKRWKKKKSQRKKKGGSLPKKKKMRKVRANRKCDHSSYLLICLLIRRLI